jgi:hypothetical protein
VLVFAPFLRHRVDRARAATALRDPLSKSPSAPPSAASAFTPPPAPADRSSRSPPPLRAPWSAEVRRVYLLGVGLVLLGAVGAVVIGVYVGWVWLLVLAPAIPLAALERSPVEAMHLFGAGLLPSRSGCMSVVVLERGINVRFRGEAFEIPFGDVQSATLSYDDGDVRVRGVDDVLRVVVDHGGILVVPESAGGYRDLVQWLQDRQILKRVPV